MRVRGSIHNSEIMTAEIYWIIGLRPGRLAILGRPRSGDWLADEIADWKAAGLTDVISLLEDGEVRDLGLAREAELAQCAGMASTGFPSQIEAYPPPPLPRRRCGVSWQQRSRKGEA